MTEDGHYLVISVSLGTKVENQLFYKRLDVPDSPVVELLTGFDAEYDFIGNDGSTFWLQTDRDAPLRLIEEILDRF